MDTSRMSASRPGWLVAAWACLVLLAAGLAAPAQAGAVSVSGQGQARSVASAASGGVVTGRVIWNDGTPAPAELKLLDWEGRIVASAATPASGRFTMTGVDPGTYDLLVTDKSPRWQVTCFGATRQQVVVREGETVARHVMVRRGAFITGRVTRAPSNARASRARIVASDVSGLSLDVRANNRGEFALCGFNRGKVRVWAYDAGRRWVGKPRDLRMRPARGVHIMMRMRNPAGALHGFVHVDGQLPTKRLYITAVSRRTGQWWVVPVRRGEISMRGLVPGRYQFILPAVGSYGGGTVSPAVRVRPWQSRAVNFWLSEEGARVG